MRMQRFWGAMAKRSAIDLNYALHSLDCIQEISVKGEIVFNCFLITKLSL